MAVRASYRPVYHVAELRAVARAGQQRRQCAHHDREVDTLELPDRGKQSIERGCDRHTVFVRPVDSRAHGKGANDLAHGVVTVDDDGSLGVSRNARRTARIDALARELAHVVRRSQATVQMDASKVEVVTLHRSS